MTTHNVQFLSSHTAAVQAEVQPLRRGTLYPICAAAARVETCELGMLLFVSPVYMYTYGSGESSLKLVFITAYLPPVKSFSRGFSAGEGI